MSNETTELIELPAADTCLQVFTNQTKLDEILDAVRQRVIGTVYDMDKRKDREACASDAYKVARTKAAMEKLRAATSAELKELPKKVDAGGRYLKEGFEAIQAEVRAPLDAWEAAEKARVDELKSWIDGLRRDQSSISECTAEDLRISICAFEGIIIDSEWLGEFETEARRVKDDTLELLRKALPVREKYEAEQAELAELRRKQAEQEQKDRETEIARQAADKARAEAEAKAQAERDAAAKREAEIKAAQAKAEQDAKDAIERQRQAEARAEAEKLAAEQRAKDAAEAARLAELKRQDDEKAAAEAEQRRREADKQHKASINNAALAAFIENGLPEECAKQAVVLIAKGLIPAVRIQY